jgi:hypothetical protein
MTSKRNNSNGTDSPKDGVGVTAKRGTGMVTVRGKETRQTQTYRAEGIRAAFFKLFSSGDHFY